MRYIWLAALAGLMLAILGYAADASQARQDGRQGDALASIGYRFNGAYGGAWRDSRDAWNKIARRRGLPELVRAREGEPVDLVIESRCRSGDLTGRYREAREPGILFINRCDGLSKIERRKVYSHELGHVYDLAHRPGGVMPTYIEHQHAVYPTARDARLASSRYDGV